MTYDRKAIMTAAWAAHRSIGAGLAKMTKAGRAQRFAYCLRDAWERAKIAARRAAPAAPLSEAEGLRRAILVLECKDRLFHADLIRLDVLRAELRAAA